MNTPTTSASDFYAQSPRHIPPPQSRVSPVAAKRSSPVTDTALKEKIGKPVQVCGIVLRKYCLNSCRQKKLLLKLTAFKKVSVVKISKTYFYYMQILFLATGPPPPIPPRPGLLKSKAITESPSVEPAPSDDKKISTNSVQNSQNVTVQTADKPKETYPVQFRESLVLVSFPDLIALI